MDLPVVIDRRDKTPVWLQLSRSLRERILEGQLAAGVSMPSSRELGEMLGLSRATVVKSYTDLISQGYLDATPGGGTFVSRSVRRQEPGTEDTGDSAADNSSPAMERLSVEGQRLMQLRIARATSGDLPELNYGSPPVDMLPARQWKEIMISHCRLQNPHRLDYQPETFGDFKLRVAIAAYLGRAKALRCDPEQIIVFSGSQQALYYICRLLLDPGDSVVVEHPGYGGARNAILSRGASLLPVSVDVDGMIVSDIPSSDDEKIKLAYVTPSAHDPTGMIMSLDRRKALLEWASRTGAFIVEDAWDGDYTYVKPPLPSLQGLDRDERVLYIYSFWKVLYPLLTVGVLVLPRPLIPVFERAKMLAERQFPLLEHYALCEFIEEGFLERHIKKTRSIYERRRQALIAALSSVFRWSATIPKQSSGLHLCVRFSMQFPETELLECARAAGLPLVSTRPYYLDNAPACEFLIPFAILSDSEIAERVNGFAARIARLKTDIET